MGTIVSRGKSFRAVVRTGGETKTKTFATRKEAGLWITTTEAGVIANPRLARGTTLGFVMEKMRARELAKPYKSSGADLFARLHREIGHIDLADCTADFWQKVILSWKSTPYSRLTNIRRIRGALSTAEALWNVKVNWDALRLAMARLAKAREIGKGRPRLRRVSDAELTKLKATALREYTGKMPLCDIIDFAIATCMRQAEIVRITWDDLNGNMQWIRDRKDPKEKMGNDQNIPLLGNALKIIKRQPRMHLPNGTLEPRIFPFNSGTLCNTFRVIISAAEIKGLHFHDLRHEGISRLFEQGYGIPEVCNVSGHKSWETLRIYTHLSGAALHQGPIAHRRAA